MWSKSYPCLHRLGCVIEGAKPAYAANVAVATLKPRTVGQLPWESSTTSSMSRRAPDAHPVMLPGQVCRIYTNEYHPECCGFNYGSGSAIWNNTGDCAYLRDGQSTLIDELLLIGRASWVNSKNQTRKRAYIRRKLMRCRNDIYSSRKPRAYSITRPHWGDDLQGNVHEKEACRWICSSGPDIHKQIPNSVDDIVHITWNTAF